MKRGADPGASARRGSLQRFLLFGSFGVLGAQLLGLFSGTATQLLLARLLTPELLAAYFLTQSVVEVVAHVAHLGLPRPLTRFVAQALGTGSRGEARGAVTTALPLALGASALVAALYAAGPGAWVGSEVLGSSPMAEGAGLAALWLAAYALLDLFTAGIRGFRRVGAAALLAGALHRTLLAAVLGLLLWSGFAMGFEQALWIALAATAVSVAISGIVLARCVSPLPRSKVPAGLLLRASLPLLLTGVVQMSLARVDLWIVGGALTQEHVALYGAAKRLIALVSLPLVVLNLVVPPVVAELYAKGERANLQRVLRGAATLAGVPAIAMLLVFAVSGGPILGLAFGEFYREGAVVLAILSVERLVWVWVGPCGMLLVMTGHERVFMTLSIFTTAFTTATTFVGAKWGGFDGLAMGYLVGSATHQLVSWATARRKTGVRTDVDPWNVGGVLEAARRALRRESSGGSDAS